MRPAWLAVLLTDASVCCTVEQVLAGCRTLCACTLLHVQLLTTLRVLAVMLCCSRMVLHAGSLAPLHWAFHLVMLPIHTCPCFLMHHLAAQESDCCMLGACLGLGSHLDY